MLYCLDLSRLLLASLAKADEVKCREEQATGGLLFSISEIFHKTFTIKRLTIDKLRNIMKSQVGEKLICKTKMNIWQNRREAVTQSQGTFLRKCARLQFVSNKILFAIGFLFSLYKSTPGCNYLLISINTGLYG